MGFRMTAADRVWKQGFVFLRHYIILITFSASSDIHFQTHCAVLRPFPRINVWFALVQAS